MKTMFCLLVLLATSLSVYVQGEKQSRSDEDYRVRTLREVTTLQPDYIAKEIAAKPDEKLRIIVHADLLPSRIKVHYDGETRPLVEDKKNLIIQWVNRLPGIPDLYTVAYQNETLFTDDGESHWLVVKKEFLPLFEQELKKGDTVELFLIKMGNIRIADKLEPVLLVEKFVKQ